MQYYSGVANRNVVAQNSLRIQLFNVHVVCCYLNYQRFLLETRNAHKIFMSKPLEKHLLGRLRRNGILTTKMELLRVKGRWS
jgi:hypothetical protein